MKKGKSIRIIPASIQEADDFLAQYRRDYQSLPGIKFAIGCAVDGKLAGAIVVRRCQGDSLTVQVDGICTVGGRAAYCMLYGAAARAAKAMGFHRIMAFLPVGRPDSALRSAGWKRVGPAGGELHPVMAAFPGQKLLRYERVLTGR